MWRACIAALLAACLVVSLSGCGTIIVRGNLNGNESFVSGFVTGIQSGNVVVDGTFIKVTIVTLVDNGSSTQFDFCGSIGNQFSMQTLVNVGFTQSPSCLTLVFVTVQTG